MCPFLVEWIDCECEAPGSCDRVVLRGSSQGAYDAGDDIVCRSEPGSSPLPSSYLEVLLAGEVLFETFCDRFRPPGDAPGQGQSGRTGEAADESGFGPVPRSLECCLAYEV